MSKTTSAAALVALVEALVALGPKLSEAQAGNALEALLTQIGKTTDPDVRVVFVEAVRALAGKLSSSQASDTVYKAKSLLGWATSETEAAEWARALTALLDRASPPDAALQLAGFIAYPMAGGEPTGVLFDAIRTERPDAPKKEFGTEAALEWLAKTYPDVLRPPICPQPPQPGLKCPPSASQ
jgi:hypothetical protein